MDSVGVGEQEPVGAGGAGSGGNGIVLAGPARGQRIGIDHLHAGERLRDFFGAVAGVVIDDDDLEGNVVLLHERFETSPQIGFFVARGDDHRNLRRHNACFRDSHRSNRSPNFNAPNEWQGLKTIPILCISRPYKGRSATLRRISA
jgi:hypothetical protein